MPSYYCSNFDLTSKPDTTHLFLAEGEAEVGFIDRYLQSIAPKFTATTILCFKGLGNVRDKTDTLAKLIEKGPSGLDQLRGIGVMGDAEDNQDNPSGQLDVAIQIAHRWVSVDRRKISEKHFNVREMVGDSALHCRHHTSVKGGLRI